MQHQLRFSLFIKKKKTIRQWLNTNMQPKVVFHYFPVTIKGVPSSQKGWKGNTLIATLLLAKAAICHSDSSRKETI